LIDNLANINPLIYSEFYRTLAEYYKSKQDYENYYNKNLQYLAYTNEVKLTNEQKVNISIEMAQAILISKKIFNFSELVI